MEKNSNGLSLLRIFSGVKPGQTKENDFNLLTLIDTEFGKSEGWAVLYLVYGIRFAKYENSTLSFYNNEANDFKKYGISARIFNKDKELKIWKEGDTFFWRLRTDSENGAKKVDVVEAQQIMWGTITDDLGDGWTCLTEERGTELIIPLKIDIPKQNPEDKEKEPLKRAAIKTRNYIFYINDALASYCDDRFVELKEWGEK